MYECPINGMMNVTMEKIKEMVDVNTVIGDPIVTADNTVIIPVSKVSYGFVSGGSDFPSKKTDKEYFGGGSGAGITISPIGFLVVCDGDVKFTNIESYNDSLDRAVGMIPEVFDKIAALFKKDKKSKTDDVKLDDPII